MAPESAIAIVGVGYVGLPLAMALARCHPDVIAYDLDAERIAELRAGHDRNDIGGGLPEIPPTLEFSGEAAALRRATAYIITVPTPIDDDRRPDLTPLRAACRQVGAVIGAGDLVIVESTVYPGVTEEICGPAIAEVSGLRPGADFKLGYSPERINAGDRHNTLDSVTKIVAGQDSATLERVSAIYRPAIGGGLYRAPAIKVAEAAKVVENIQRDLNIALMNELALIFDRMGIRTSDVIDAAATKWNFQRFTPGLVGGHCIGVDPYYLISRAERLGCFPEIIRAARRLNNSLASHIVRKTVDLVIAAGRPVSEARIGVLGVTFKENVTDFRNSQSPEIITELGRFGATVFAHDPYADSQRLRREHDVELCAWEDLQDLDAAIVTVPHRTYTADGGAAVAGALRSGGVLIDIKSAFDPGGLGRECRYWSL